MGRPRRDLRDQILAVAEERFFRRGFNRVTLAELAASLRTSKSAFYRCFANKEELVLAVAERLNETIDARIGEIVRSNRRFDEKLASILAFTVETLKRVGDRFLRDLEHYTPGIWERYLAVREERVRGLYGKLFLQGQQTGELRTDLPLEAIVSVYLKLTELVVSPPAQPEIGAESSESYQTITALFLEGSKPQYRLVEKKMHVKDGERRR